MSRRVEGKQQIPRQMRWSLKTCSKQYGMLEAFMTNFTLMIFVDSKQWLPIDFAENLQEKNVNKSLVLNIRYINIQVMKSCTVKLCK